MRQAAVEKLTDQAMLAKVAKTDGDPAVCRAAMERITDQALLAEIAKTDPNLHLRAAAADALAVVH